MGSATTVSVVTSSFGQAQFLSATIQSVLTQDHPSLEYIIIDGASTDGSLDIIRRHADRLAWWVSEPDRGQADAINKGMRRATGSIMAWLNSDDTYLPGAVSAAVRFLEQHPEVDVIYGDVDFVASSGARIETMRAWPFNARLQVCATNLVPQPAAFFRRKVWEQAGGLDEGLHYALDYDLWVRASLTGARFAHVPQLWATYRLHDQSKTEAHALQFVSEVRQVVERAFTHDGAPPGWRADADSNLDQLAAETHLRLGNRRQARRHFLRAAARRPLRPKVLALLAFAASPRLGLALRRIRWRMAGRTDQPWLR